MSQAAIDSQTPAVNPAVVASTATVQADQPDGNLHSPCSDIALSDHHLPEFPQEAYVGVLADFADLYSKHYESPKEFFFFDALTIVAIVLSGRARADFGDLEPHTRLYGFKIGPSGTSKKSSSFKMAKKFVTSAVSQATGDDMFATNEQSAQDEALRVLSGAGSGEGLAVALTRNHRVLLYFDEFERFLKKAGADSSILGMIVNELFESLEFSNVTRDRDTYLNDAHLGFATNMSLEQFESVSGVNQLVEIGLWNRLMFVVGNRRHKCPTVSAPSKTRVEELTTQAANMLAPYLSAREEKILPLTPEAKVLWGKIDDVIGTDEDTTRLDTIGMRVMTVLAVTSGKKEIDAAVIHTTFAFLRYQKTIRQRYKPSQAETVDAKIEAAILKQLKQRGPLSDRDLERYANASRYGTPAFKKVRDALEREKKISRRKGDKLWEISEALQ